MNDPSQPPSQAVDTPIDAAGPVRTVDPSRRRLVRSGLAGSVLLGSLVSKPVLGAGYICTVSGHASGNASAHLMDIDCNSGDSPEQWVAATSWPTGFDKGGLPNRQCGFPQSGPNAQGTLFNGLPLDGQTLAATFFYSTSGDCAVGTTPGDDYAAASMLQILESPDTTDDPDRDELFRLGKATIASLLNIALNDGEYPVSSRRVIDMFNKVKDGAGVYPVPSVNMSLTRVGVIRYLEKLYTPSV